MSCKAQAGIFGVDNFGDLAIISSLIRWSVADEKVEYRFRWLEGCTIFY